MSNEAMRGFQLGDGIRKQARYVIGGHSNVGNESDGGFVRMICAKCGRETEYQDLDPDNVCSRCNEAFLAMFRRQCDQALEHGTLVRTPKGVASPNFTIGDEYVVGGVPMVYRGVYLGDETEFYQEITHVFESGLDVVEYLMP